MFSYFPGNYVWNLAVDIALESGGQIGEIDEMCAPLRDAANRGVDAETATFAASWVAMADRLHGLAAEDEAAGRNFSAGTKLQRAALYYQTAERMQPHGAPGRMTIFQQGRDSFRAAIRLGRDNLERVEINYGEGTIPGYLTRATAGDAPHPTVVFANGLDSSKEMLVWTGVAAALARRGVSTLHIDQPGSGEALRTHGLTAVVETERWASPVIDWLETLPDVDARRIGMLGVSLGGYYVPRAVAFEPRLALGAVWGANHNWGEVQRKRLNREGENPVPHYWEHVRWVWGAADTPAFLAIADRVTLDGVLDRVKVPFLVAHGEADRQISVDYARRTFEQLVNSPKRELKIFDRRTGGVEHVSLDNMPYGRDFIADWIAETFWGAYGMSLVSGSPFRRIVTGHDSDNRAVIVADAAPTRVFDQLGEPGLVFHEVWNTPSTPAVIDRSDTEPQEERLTLAPPAGGTRIRVLDIPPDDGKTDFDVVFDKIGGSEALLGAQPDRHANFHRTRSIDYGIVLDGEITLLMDVGETVVRAGDIVIQRGTNHGWANRSDRPCRIAFILIDGVYGDGIV